MHEGKCLILKTSLLYKKNYILSLSQMRLRLNHELMNKSLRNVHDVTNIIVNISKSQLT